MAKKLFISLFFLSSLFMVGLIYFSGNHIGADMPITPAVFADNYNEAVPATRDFYDTVYSFSKNDLRLGNKDEVVGIAPHHLLAGDMLAEFYSNLSNRNPEIVILIGPNHFEAGRARVISSDYDWRTPFGVLTCDQELLRVLARIYPDMGIEPEVAESEHAITSHAGFVRKTFPEAKFLPLILRANIDGDEADKLARALVLASGNRKALLIASVDFSHNTDLNTAVVNDKLSLAVIEGMDLTRVYELAVDSPPSVYAAIRYADLNGARFMLLRNSNSALLANRSDLKNTTSYITGFFTR